MKIICHIDNLSDLFSVHEVVRELVKHYPKGPALVGLLCKDTSYSAQRRHDSDTITVRKHKESTNGTIDGNDNKPE